LSGDSGNLKKLYFYIYESPNQVGERLQLSVKQDEKDLEKTFEPLDFETLMKKIGFYQR